MSEYTPGPWYYGVRRDGSTWLSLGDPGVRGSEHHQGDFFGKQADARLISAAPDLLEALKEAIQDFAIMRYGSRMEKWDAAIAKAEGTK